MQLGPWAAAATVLGVVLLRGRWRWAAAVVVVGAAGGASAKLVDRGRCAARLESGAIEAAVRVVVPAAPGRIGSLELLGQHCRGPVAFRAAGTDTLWAGWRGTVGGTWRRFDDPWRAADGLISIRRAAGHAGSAGPVGSIRNGILRAIGRLYGPRSGMIEALVLGSRGTIAPDLQQAFGRSGLVHLLSISGFHVGLIWAWVYLVLGLARVRRRGPIAAVLVVAYVGFIGFPAPAVRAAWLACLSAASRFRQRHPSPGPLFALCAWVVLLFDPWALFDLGAWLSVGSLWGATAAVRWSDRALGEGAGWRMISGSVGATLATAPATAWALGTVALAGIGLNPVAIPLAAAAVPAVLASLLAWPIAPSVAGSVAAGGGALLGLLESLARAGAALPGAALTFDPGPGPAVLALGAIVAAVMVFGGGATAREAGRRAAWVVGVAMAGLLLVDLAPIGDDGPGLALHFLDVGQGDAALIRTAADHWVLVDGGPSDERTDAGLRVIIPFLARHGIRRLEAVILSHGHRDHYGGLAAVLEAVEVGRVFEPGEPVDDPHYLSLLDALADRAIPWIPVRRGTRFAVDDVRFTAIHPDTAWAEWGTDLNEDSAVLLVERGSFRALFMGDAGIEAETHIGARIPAVDLLKVGHHGSRTASGAEWLATTRPTAAVVSVGRVNRYGHPTPEALGRLGNAAAAIWRTDQDGTISVRVEGTRMLVHGAHRDAEYQLKASGMIGMDRHGDL